VSDEAVMPFHVRVPDADLADLRDRIVRTRWPEPQVVPDWSQGVPLAYLQELCRYWRTHYDWRKVEAQLNALPLSTAPSSTGSASTSCTSGRPIELRCHWC
jgi:Epoxide hydrolase N terminus